MSGSVGRNSFIMASGTLASRLTGQVRTILLAAALGVTGIAADAYQVGSQIPQVIFNILAGGILNAILVPQIVRAFKQKDFSSRINKLLTLSIIVLFAFTVLLMLATPVLVNIYIDSGWTAPQKALANAFTLWCMPQIFFYGLYTVLGQVLAAKDRFGAYAWSSVAANIISCAGFGLFIWMFGNAKNQPLSFWGNEKIMLSAGAWTLGVAVQALILVVPLMRLGIGLKPEFGLRGIGLRSIGKVAVWSLGMVILDQLVGIVNTRITTGAPVAAGDRLGTAGSQAYMQAYSIWILPYSLIAVSLATAIFPRLSRAIAEHRIGDARSQLSDSLRTCGVIMIFFTASFVALPIPLIRSLLPTVSMNDATAMSTALLGLSFGLLPSSVALLLRRTFFAFEDGKGPFLLSLGQSVGQAIAVLVTIRFVDAHYWVGVVGAMVALSNLAILPFAFTMVRKRMEGRIDGHRIVILYAKATVAGVITTFAGLLFSPLVQRLVGVQVSGDSPHMSWVQALAVSAIVGFAMMGVYMAVLYVLKVTELVGFLHSLSARFLHRGRPASTVSAEESEEAIVAASTGVAKNLKKPQNPRLAIGTALPRSSEKPQNQKSSPSTTHQPNTRAAEGRPTGRMAHGSNMGSVRHMIPSIGDTIGGRYTLIALYRSEPGLSAWLANDHTLVRDCQLFIVSDSSKTAKVNALASSLALSKDSHFTPVLHLQKQDGISIIVTETDAGVSLHELLNDPSHAPLSPEAMRTIAGEICTAADTLRKVELAHQAISTHTVRLTTSTITLADAPISSLLTTRIKPASFNDTDEMLAVRQIGAVLFEMMTGTSFDPKAEPEQTRAMFSQYAEKAPAEFTSICTRCLGIPAKDGAVPVPIFTLEELLALLGTWTPTAELKKSDMDLPSKQSAASIESVTLAPVQPRNILNIPDSLVSSAPISQAQNNAEASPWNANQLLFEGQEAVEEIDSASPNLLSAFENSFHDDDQLGSMGDFAGFTDDQMSRMQPTQALKATTPQQSLTPDAESEDLEDTDTFDSSNIPNPPDTSPRTPRSTSTSGGSQPLIPEGATAPAPLIADDNDTSGTSQETQAQSKGTSTDAQKPRAARSSRSTRSTQTPTAVDYTDLTSEEDELENPDFVDANVGEVTSIIQPIPASFIPQNDDGDEEANAANSETESGKKGLFGDRISGKNVAIIIAAVVMIAALIWSIFHLGLTPVHSGGSTRTGDGWSIDADNAPTPGGTESEPGTESGTAQAPQKNSPNKAEGDNPNADATDTDTTDTADKTANAVPAPAATPVTNTVAYPFKSSILRNQNGLSGIGIQMHLTTPQPVQRLQIISRSGGGGKATLYANATASNPTGGTVVAEFSFNDNQQVTQVDLPQPVTTQDLVLWVSENPGNGFYYRGLMLY